MENKINIAELLKDCPKGTKLYSPIVGECTLEHIHGELKKILISASDGTTLTFNYNGTYFQMDNSECLLFPSKDQRDWSKFQRPFKDGDVIISDYGNIHLLCTKDSSYCSYRPRSKNKLDVTMTTCITVVRLATEEEKQELFDAIKSNGYKWNEETKALEKLVESNEDVDDKIVMSGIYFDRENYADEVELHLGNYEIEVRNGKTYAVFKNQETKISKPIFKVGDKIKHKDTVLTIINVKTNSYIVEDEPYNFGILMFSQQDKWELINEPKFKVGDRIKEKQSNIIGEIIDVQKNKYNVRIDDKGLYLYFREQDNWELAPDKFDINTLKPFDKVLVRDNDTQEWSISLFSHYNGLKNYKYSCINGNGYAQCIPYEENKHLLDTSNNCDNYYRTW